MCSRSRRYVKSGRTRSTPRCSSRGNARPASMTTIASSASKTVMFLPTSPSPPSGMIRHTPPGIPGQCTTGPGTLAGLDLDALGSVQFERLCAAILDGTGLTADEGVLVVAAWVRSAGRLRDVVERARREWPYAEPAAVLVLTNADDAVEADSVLGPSELAEIVAARPDLRLRVPSVLGIYDVHAALDASRSTFDVGGAAELARVFVPTRAYARAREVVER